MALTEIVDTVHQQVLDAVKAAQDVAVSNVRSWTETVERVLPEEPRARLAERLPAVPEAVDRAFEAAEQLLEAQHRIVVRLLEAAGLPGTTGPAGTAGGTATPAAA